MVRELSEASGKFKQNTEDWLQWLKASNIALQTSAGANPYYIVLVQRKAGMCASNVFSLKIKNKKASSINT